MYQRASALLFFSHSSQSAVSHSEWFSYVMISRLLAYIWYLEKRKTHIERLAGIVRAILSHHRPKYLVTLT